VAGRGEVSAASESSKIEAIENPARDLSRLDVDDERIDRAVRACKRAGLRAPPQVEVCGATLVLESMQVTGSFKVRGAVAAISAQLEDARARGVVAASAGNHGAGVAWAARAFGVRATIVVPETAPAIKRRRIAELGAELVVAQSDHYDDAEKLALELAHSRGARFFSPYDDPDVVAGNGGSLGREILAGLAPRKLDGGVVLAPVGGGGLASGLAAAFGSTWNVWGAQSAACPGMARSIERGRALEAMHADGETLAEGLEGGVSVGGFERARRALAGVLVVEERALAEAMRWAREELGLLVEGSSAVALAPLLAGHAQAKGAVIVVTGRNVD
jgi:threonine dehydratase